MRSEQSGDVPAWDQRTHEAMQRFNARPTNARTSLGTSHLGPAPAAAHLVLPSVTITEASQEAVVDEPPVVKHAPAHAGLRIHGNVCAVIQLCVISVRHLLSQTGIVGTTL